jgi:Uncharacterized protein conserved in bacteria
MVNADLYSILWRRLDGPGHESARIFSQDRSWQLEGTAVFASDGLPCRLDYQIVCNFAWQTASARVHGWVGEKTIAIDISVDPARHWIMNGLEIPLVSGCMDLDLNFSPVTNMIPIRRLDLEIGQSADVKAAWLRFSEFTLEPLDQIYRRVGPAAYRYESGDGSFSADLAVTPAGLVTLYPNLWQAE